MQSTPTPETGIKHHFSNILRSGNISRTDMIRSKKDYLNKPFADPQAIASVGGNNEENGCWHDTKLLIVMCSVVSITLQLDVSSWLARCTKLSLRLCTWENSWVPYFLTISHNL